MNTEILLPIHHNDGLSPQAGGLYSIHSLHTVVIEIEQLSFECSLAFSEPQTKHKYASHSDQTNNQ